MKTSSFSRPSPPAPSSEAVTHALSTLGNAVEDVNLQQELRTLLSESDSNLIEDALLSLGSRAEKKGNLEIAAKIYAVASEIRADSPAQVRLQAILGHGPLGPRFEVLARRFFQDASDPRNILPMLAASAVYGVVRGLAIGRLGAMQAGLLSRGTGLRLAAAGLGFAAEVPSFTLLARAMHRTESGAPTLSLSQELGMAGLTLGLFKTFSALGRGMTRRLPSMGATADSYVHAAGEQASTFGGLLAAHHLEEKLGLRPPTDRANAALGALSSLAQLGIGARLGNRLLGTGYARWTRELESRIALRDAPTAIQQSPWYRNPWLAPFWMAGASGGPGGLMPGSKNGAKISRQLSYNGITLTLEARGTEKTEKLDSLQDALLDLMVSGEEEGTPLRGELATLLRGDASLRAELLKLGTQLEIEFDADNHSILRLRAQRGDWIREWPKTEGSIAAMPKAMPAIESSLRAPRPEITPLRSRSARARLSSPRPSPTQGNLSGSATPSSSKKMPLAALTFFVQNTGKAEWHAVGHQAQRLFDRLHGAAPTERELADPKRAESISVSPKSVDDAKGKALREIFAETLDRLVDLAKEDGEMRSAKAKGWLEAFEQVLNGKLSLEEFEGIDPLSLGPISLRRRHSDQPPPLETENAQPTRVPESSLATATTPPQEAATHLHAQPPLWISEIQAMDRRPQEVAAAKLVAPGVSPKTTPRSSERTAESLAVDVLSGSREALAILGEKAGEDPKAVEELLELHRLATEAAPAEFNGLEPRLIREDAILALRTATSTSSKAFSALLELSREGALPATIQIAELAGLEGPRQKEASEHLRNAALTGDADALVGLAHAQTLASQTLKGPLQETIRKGLTHFEEIVAKDLDDPANRPYLEALVALSTLNGRAEKVVKSFAKGHYAHSPETHASSLAGAALGNSPLSTLLKRRLQALAGDRLPMIRALIEIAERDQPGLRDLLSTIEIGPAIGLDRATIQVLAQTFQNPRAIALHEKMIFSPSPSPSVERPQRPASPPAPAPLTASKAPTRAPLQEIHELYEKWSGASLRAMVRSGLFTLFDKKIQNLSMEERQSLFFHYIPIVQAMNHTKRATVAFTILHAVSHRLPPETHGKFSKLLDPIGLVLPREDAVMREFHCMLRGPSVSHDRDERLDNLDNMAKLGGFGAFRKLRGGMLDIQTTESGDFLIQGGKRTIQDWELDPPSLRLRQLFPLLRSANPGDFENYVGETEALLESLTFTQIAMAVGPHLPATKAFFRRPISELTKQEKRYLSVMEKFHAMIYDKYLAEMNILTSPPPILPK